MQSEACGLFLCTVANIAWDPLRKRKKSERRLTSCSGFPWSLTRRKQTANKKQVMAKCVLCSPPLSTLHLAESLTFTQTLWFGWQDSMVIKRLMDWCQQAFLYSMFEWWSGGNLVAKRLKLMPCNRNIAGLSPAGDLCCMSCPLFLPPFPVCLFTLTLANKDEIMPKKI